MLKPSRQYWNKTVWLKTISKEDFSWPGGSAFFNLASKEETIKVIKLLNNLPEASKKIVSGISTGKG
jgi:hypothetical protein